MQNKMHKMLTEYTNYQDKKGEYNRNTPNSCPALKDNKTWRILKIIFAITH